MILALETSCDETALALFDPAAGVAGEWIHSQVALHGTYGGVVPDLATREHVRKLPELLELARAEPGWARIDRVAVTQGPGLAGCLAVGLAGAKAVALALGVPLAGVNHLRGHAFSPFMALHREDPVRFAARRAGLLPHLGLIVSGGNTLLFCIDERLRIRVLSGTRDDAAGEALDKGAKLLGLGYPGGPLIEAHARRGRADAFPFPRGIGGRSDLDFSFSGLKTSLRYLIERLGPTEVEARLEDLCASYQQAVVDALCRKAGIALEAGAYRSVGLSGGVANNRSLRGALEEVARRSGVPLLAAESRHTGDNAGMIGFGAWVDPEVEWGRGLELALDPSVPLAVGPGSDVGEK